jgi:hypothetical protein
VAKVDKDVRVVKWRACADAHELLGAYFDHGNPRIVVKMRYKQLRHEQSFTVNWQLPAKRPSASVANLFAPQPLLIAFGDQYDHGCSANA